MDLNTIKYLAQDPKRLFSMLGSKGALNWMPDRLYLKILFRLSMGQKLDLKDPKTFNEKLQWLKLYDRDPLYTKLVDKYEVRSWVAEKIGEEYLVPMVGGPWDRAEDIDFDALPDQFVLKCTHDSGGVIVVRDKKELDISQTIAWLNKRLSKNFYWVNREWPYKNVKPRIIAEKYMVNGDEPELLDYKFMVFNGHTRCSFVCSDRQSEDGLHVSFFDMDWRPMPFTRHYPASEDKIPKPQNYERMVELAETLASGLQFVRIDLYQIDGAIYFGEYTFFPGNGMEEFRPKEWDYTIGSWLELPERN